MANSTKFKKVVDTVQWVLIVLLAAGCLYLNHEWKESLKSFTEISNGSTYTRIYDSQSIEALKKENKALYDTIKAMGDVESVMDIRYKFVHTTDTIRVTEFVQSVADSVYHYTDANDTVSIDVDVKAKDLEWMKAGFTVNDGFLIVNRENGGTNTLSIASSSSSNVTNVSAWHRTEDRKWYQRFTVSPQVGVGYGLVHGKGDVYVGVGVGYNFNW